MKSSKATTATLPASATSPLTLNITKAEAAELLVAVSQDRRAIMVMPRSEWTADMRAAVSVAAKVDAHALNEFVPNGGPGFDSKDVAKMQDAADAAGCDTVVDLIRATMKRLKSQVTCI